MSGESEALAAVYAAKAPDELAQAYGAWAAAYDRDTLALGYCLPFAVASWVARHVAPGSGPLLDVGCGTGLSGPLLRALGFAEIEGLDFSADMLRLAQARGSYSALTRATLGEPLPWPDGRFAAAFCAGVFTEGHAPASSLEEIARVVAPGGCVIATVRTSIFEDKGFAAAFERLRASGRWRPVEASPPFRAFAVAEPEVLVRVFVFRVA